MRFKHTKRSAKVLALLIAIVLCFSGCSEADEIVAAINALIESNADTALRDVDGVESMVDPINGAESDTSAADQAEPATDDAESILKDHRATESASYENHATQDDTRSDSSADDTVTDQNYEIALPTSVRSKGISLLLWRDLHPTEQILIDDFTEKTGCEVNVIITTEKEYTTKLVSLITGGMAPDVVALQTENFPGIAIKSMQPLDSALFQLEDAFWHKPYMDPYKINGKYFGVATSGSWNSEDCFYVTYYQPKVLRACGVSATPYQLYQEGNWNWEAQKNIASMVTGATGGYAGLSLQSYDLFMLSAGTDFVSYDGRQFTSNLNSTASHSLLTRAWQEAADLHTNGLSTGWNLRQFRQGNIGLLTAIAYGMYSESNWNFTGLPGGGAEIEVVPVAGPSQSEAYTPYRPKTWGVGKGASNPEGAAYFLRYFLDPANNAMNDTFLNAQCKEVFEIIRSTSTKKIPRYGIGAINYNATGMYEGICNNLNSMTTGTVAAQLNDMARYVQDNSNRLNAALARLQ